SVSITSPYRELLERRLRAEAILRKQRLGFALRRPDLSYSRGLLLIAAYLEQKGHLVQYLIYPDLNDARRFANLCAEADIVGFTAMTPVVQQVYALCRQVKVLNPSALCVLGGPHANIMGVQCLEECPELDVVIAREGELAFAELVDHLEADQDIAGVIYRHAGHETIQNPVQPSDRSIVTADLPGPAYHLLNRSVSAYAHNIRTFLGCPYKCNFCIERLSWRGRKGRISLERVIEEIRLV